MPFVWPLVLDKRVKFHDRSLNDNDVISGMAVDNVGIDVLIKFGGSRSNGFLDIQGADLVSNERTNIGEAYPNSAKRPRRFA